MRETDYAYCVARLRARERNLLTQKDIEDLIDSKDLDTALQMLVDKKWLAEKTDIARAVEYQNKLLWDTLTESVPDKNELNKLCCINDFFNIKAAVKCHFASKEPQAYYAYPTSLDLKALTESVAQHSFGVIAGSKGECAREGYMSAVTTENGQNCDIIIDRACINEMKSYAEKKSDALTKKIFAFLCDTANIKIALRCVGCKKEKDFLDGAVGECVFIDRGEVIAAALRGEEALMEYLVRTPYKKGIEKLTVSFSEFEKWCDSSVLKISAAAKFTAFGFDPVSAYYFRKQTEIKTVRIILTCIKSGILKDKIRERVKGLYV